MRSFQRSTGVLLAAAGAVPALAQSFPATRICCSTGSPMLPAQQPPAMGDRLVAFLADDTSVDVQGVRGVYASEISRREQFTLVAQRGQPTPQDPNFSWRGFDSPVVDGDRIGFSSTTWDLGGGPYTGVYVSQAGGPPTTWLDTLQPEGTTILLPMGFNDSILVQKNIEVVQVHAPGSSSRLLSVGDAAPGGGTIVGLYSEFSVAGDIGAYKVTIEHAPGEYAEAIIAQNLTTNQLHRVIDWTQSLPGLGAYDNLRWAQTDGDLIYFVAGQDATATEPLRQGLYSVPVAGGIPSLLALTGDFAPGGGVFTQFAAFSPLQAADGQVAFEAAIGSGALAVGIYLFGAEGIERVIGPGEFLETGLVAGTSMGPQALKNGRLVANVSIDLGNPFVFDQGIFVFDVWPCRGDLTGSSDPSSPAYGVRDRAVDLSDFFFFLDLFVADDGLADMTGSSDPFDPQYGVPDGVIDGSDFFYYIDRFAEGCHD